MMETLKTVLERVLPGTDLSGVTRDTRLVEDLGFDSLSLMMMAMGIEDAYGFKFTEFVRFATVGDVIDYVDERKTKG